MLEGDRASCRSNLNLTEPDPSAEGGAVREGEAPAEPFVGTTNQCNTAPQERRPPDGLTHMRLTFLDRRITSDARNSKDRTAGRGAGERVHCERRDSNPQPLRDQILNLARMPIPPLSR